MEEASNTTLKATIYFDGSFWIAIFERMDEMGYSIARVLFGGEPTEPEIFQYIIHNFNQLKFGSPKKCEIEEKKVNPKRAQREAKREMERLKESSRPSSFAQNYMREELEKNKKEKKKITKEQKEARKIEQFLLRQTKKKEKHKGH